MHLKRIERMKERKKLEVEPLEELDDGYNRKITEF